MKTMIRISLVMTCMAIIFVACKEKKEGTDESGRKILTERIQYDVFIKPTDTEQNWWVQNIEGSKRESFVKTFINLACEGKVKAYDYFNTPLTPEEVKKIDNFSDTITVPDINDPDKTKDTVVKHELDIQKITKVRFLEEWYLDEKKMSLDKKVVGVMLMKENYRDSMKLYTPLFWLYFDDKYPAIMK